MKDMNFIDFMASFDDEGRRLDRILKKIFLNYKVNTNVYRLLRKNLIKVNEGKAKENIIIHKDDIISIAEFLLRKENHESSDFRESKLPINTVFKNEHVWVINKDADIAVQKSNKNSYSLSDEVLRAFYEDTYKEKSLSFKPGPVHRIDKKTSGLVIFSQSLTGAKWISENIQNHNIKKTYLAIVSGKLLDKEKWTDYIYENDLKDNQFKTVKITGEDKGKKAITNAIPLSCGKFKGKDITLVEFKIETGRKHQIRAQSAFHGFPLLGDTAYGEHSYKNHFLHACRLDFPKENPLSLPDFLEADIPLSFSNFLEHTLINWNGQLII